MKQICLDKVENIESLINDNKYYIEVFEYSNAFKFDKNDFIVFCNDLNSNIKTINDNYKNIDITIKRTKDINDFTGFLFFVNVTNYIIYIEK